MTNLPRFFVPVASWLTIVLLATTVSFARALSGYTGPMEGAPGYVTLTWVGVIAFDLFIIASLFQLRPYGIWLSVALAGIFAATSLLRLPMLIATGGAVLIIWVGLVSSMLNIVSAWYLTRPGVLSLLALRRRERQHEAMRRYAERQVRKAAHL